MSDTANIGMLELLREAVCKLTDQSHIVLDRDAVLYLLANHDTAHEALASLLNAVAGEPF